MLIIDVRLSRSYAANVKKRRIMVMKNLRNRGLDVKAFAFLGFAKDPLVKNRPTIIPILKVVN